LKILIINPNISEDVTRLIEAEARRSAPPGVELTCLTAPFGVAYIETRAEAQVGGYAAMELAAQHHRGHDAVVIAAFGDPGLQAVREIMPIPVVGLTEAAVTTACMLGGRFSIVAISQRIQSWYRECVTAHGLADRLASLRALDEPIEHIGKVQDSKAERLVSLARQAIEQDGADTLIMAGAPLAGLARSVSSEIPVPVLDGVTCAINQARQLVALGVAPPTAGSYAMPPEKAQRGLSPALAECLGRRPVSEPPR